MPASRCIYGFPEGLFRGAEIHWPLLFLQFSSMSSLKLAQSALQKLMKIFCGVCDEVKGDG